MLREVMKKFDGDFNITFKPGDIVDVSGWQNAGLLENQGYIRRTDATKPTVDQSPPKKTSTASSARKQPARKLKRSALASRPRVFSRKAKQGE